MTPSAHPRGLVLVLPLHALSTAVLLSLRYGPTIGLGSIWLGIVLISSTAMGRRAALLPGAVAIAGIASMAMLGQLGWQPSAGHAMRDTTRFINWIRYALVALMSGSVLTWVTHTTYAQRVSSTRFEAALER